MSEEQQKRDWVSEIPIEYFIVNKEACERDSIEYEYLSKEDIQELEPKYKLISLDGFKWLLREHGYKEIEESGAYSEGDFSFFSGPRDNETEEHFNSTYVAHCKIVWDDGEKLTTVTTVGEANKFTTDGFAKNYIPRMACNRALVANVKLFLGIRVLGSDELNPKREGKIVAPAPKLSAKALEIANLCKQANIDIDQFKARASKLKNMESEISKLQSFDDLDQIQEPQAMRIIAALKKSLKL